jgi:hypothetical protein
MDHVWDGFYTGLKRLSQFHSLVQTNKDDYDITYRGTLPNKMRLQLQHADATDYIVAKQRYTTPRTIKVTNKNTGNLIRPTVYRTGVTLNSSDSCGSNIYNGAGQTIQFLLTGDTNCELYLEVTNSVKGSVRYSMDIDEFFKQDGPTKFVDNLVMILGIDPSRVRVTSVERGSSIVNFDLDGSKQPTTVTGNDVNEINIELKILMATLETAAKNGSLAILNSTVLDYTFKISLKNYVEPTEESTGVSSAILAVAGVIGGAAVVTGGVFAYKAYAKKKRTVGGSKPKKGSPADKYALSKNVDTSNINNTVIETDGKALQTQGGKE